MKLFYKSGACSLSPHIVLEESGLPYTLEAVDLKAKTLADGASYLTVNPKGSVPALEIEAGDVLTEGPAIVQFIADKAGNTDLMPAAGTRARYRVQELLNFISTELHKAYGPLFRPDTPADYQPIAKATIAAKYKIVDGMLSKGAFLTGTAFTAADAYLYAVTRWAFQMRLDMAAFPNVHAFMKHVEARPKVQAVLTSEELAPMAAA